MSANVSAATPKALQEEVHRRVRAIFEAPDVETARALLAKFSADYQHSAPVAVATLERGFDDATAVLALPEPYRQRLRTTNAVERLVERLNEEVRRRERVIRIFPNRESVVRLLGALLMEQDEAWTTGKRYFKMTAYGQWRREQAASAEQEELQQHTAQRSVSAICQTSKVQKFSDTVGKFVARTLTPAF